MKSLRILKYISILIVFSCTGPAMIQGSFTLVFHSSPTKSEDPGPVLFTDCNILVYNSFGTLEERAFVKNNGEELKYETKMLQGEDYTVLAAANLGYPLPPMTLEEAKRYRYTLAYSDEFSRGIPLACITEIRASGESASIPLERIMSKVDVTLDKSALDSDVKLDLRELRIESCPKSAGLFSTLEEETPGRFSFIKATGQDPGLYMLEDPAGESVLEIRSFYHSDSWNTLPGRYLIYRYRLGPIGRNGLYPVTIRPEGTGLGDGSDPWRIDRSGLQPTLRFDLHPAAYNECRVSDSYRIWCDILPRDTPTTIEVLEYDADSRVADIFDYSLDPDGHGLTIHPRKSGSAVVYFSTAEPLQRDTLAMLVIQN